MHNGFLQVEGEKMSKSLGNFITIHDLLEGLAGRGRCASTCCARTTASRSTGRRKGLEESQATLDRWGEISDRVGGSLVKGSLCDAGVVEALKDDLNTPLAIARLHELAKEAKGGNDIAGEKWLASAAFLGFDVSRWHARAQSADLVEVIDPDLAIRVKSLVAQRGEARKLEELQGGRPHPRRAGGERRPPQGCQGSRHRRDRHNVGVGAMTAEQAEARVERRLPVRRGAFQGGRATR